MADSDNSFSSFLFGSAQADAEKRKKKTAAQKAAQGGNSGDADSDDDAAKRVKNSYTNYEKTGKGNQ